MSSLIRSRWAAIGAAVAVTLGAGGLITANAATAQSVFVAVEPLRILDSRTGVGLDVFTSDQPQDLKVIGIVPAVVGDTVFPSQVVPAGATAIVANVTAVEPTTNGWVSVRPGTATGKPTTSNINFTTAGVIEPNSVTVEVPTTGTEAGLVEIWFHGTAATATTHMLLDVVGYYVPAGAGTPGPQGDTGATGQRGFSAWDRIPSGVTVTGSFIYEAPIVVNGGFNAELVSFPGKAPSAPTAVNFAPDASAATTDDDPTCTGSSAAPTAPPGQVCVYREGGSGFDSASALPLSVLGLSPTDGFWIRFFSDEEPPGGLWLYASWAYTAP